MIPGTLSNVQHSNTPTLQFCIIPFAFTKKTAAERIAIHLDATILHLFLFPSVAQPDQPQPDEKKQDDQDEKNQAVDYWRQGVKLRFNAMPQGAPGNRGKGRDSADAVEGDVEIVKG